jgi:adenylate kinase
MNIILLGAPGVGKGTQAKKIVEEFKLAHISTGDILRAAVKNETKLGLKAKKYMDAGDLVPDEVVIGLVKERLQEKDTEAGFILDGFPRTIPQAVALTGELKDIGKEIDVAIAISVDPNIIVKRLTSRRVCKECGNIGSAANEKCPSCGGEMFQRDDDKEEVVRNRFDVYEKSSAPLLDYYNGTGKLHEIEGTRTPDEVFADVKSVLANFK